MDIIEFVDQIDSRGGYYQGIATSLDNFTAELQQANAQKTQEHFSLQQKLNKERDTLSTEHVHFVQQLVQDLSTPVQEINESLPYKESHRSIGALDQDKLMPHIEERLKNKKYEPEGLTEKHLKRLPSLSNRFLLYKGRIYRRGVENQHRLYVPKD